VPRRLKAPRPPLADDTIRLEPLVQAHVPALSELVDDDDIRRFTYIPTAPGERFVEQWVGRYERGWQDGSCAGFAVLDPDGRVVGFAAIVRLDLDAREGEIGYMISREARGRGIAGRALRLLTGWGLGELELERLELRIDVTNPGSELVAERAGYRGEGVLRSVHFKEGRRSDVGVWSRLSSDGDLPARASTPGA
jgi:RimJ/RimL family protein N-acetyltransferase